MTGIELLARARKMHPNAVRMLLSGCTKLDSLIEANNRGEIYRFVTKPWNDTNRLESVGAAFRYYAESTALVINRVLAKTSSRGHCFRRCHRCVSRAAGQKSGACKSTEPDTTRRFKALAKNR